MTGAPTNAELADALDAGDLTQLSLAAERLREAEAETVRLYDALARINDKLERGDDGYVRFGSANDAEYFDDLLHDLEAEYWKTSAALKEQT